MKLLPAVLLTSATLCSLSVIAADAAVAKNPLSVHVLNLQNGEPTAGVQVELEQKQHDKWVKLAEGTTDQNGRIGALFPSEKTFGEGDYKVIFKTGDYYQKIKQQAFFPEIPVIFHVAKSDQHYHIPLLLSPYGYSTYRGN